MMHGTYEPLRRLAVLIKRLEGEVNKEKEAE